jgi:hypothetical protein
LTEQVLFNCLPLKSPWHYPKPHIRRYKTRDEALDALSEACLGCARF